MKYYKYNTIWNNIIHLHDTIMIINFHMYIKQFCFLYLFLYNFSLFYDIYVFQSFFHISWLPSPALLHTVHIPDNPAGFVVPAWQELVPDPTLHGAWVVKSLCIPESVTKPNQSSSHQISNCSLTTEPTIAMMVALTQQSR